MAISTIDKSQRTAARIAGLAFPISFAIVVEVNFGIFARLIVSGNPAETARNILATKHYSVLASRATWFTTLALSYS